MRRNRLFQYDMANAYGFSMLIIPALRSALEVARRRFSRASFVQEEPLKTSCLLGSPSFCLGGKDYVPRLVCIQWKHPKLLSVFKYGAWASHFVLHSSLALFQRTRRVTFRAMLHAYRGYDKRERGITSALKMLMTPKQDYQQMRSREQN